MPRPAGALLLACLAACVGAAPQALRGGARSGAASSASSQASAGALIGGPTADANSTGGGGQVLFVGLPDIAGADAVDANGSFRALLVDSASLWHAGGWHAGCGPWAGCHAGHWHAGGWHYASDASALSNATKSTNLPDLPQRSMDIGASNLTTKSSASNVFVVRVPMPSNASDSPSILGNHSVMLFSDPEAFWHAGGWHAGYGPVGGWHAGHWHAGGYHAPGWAWHAGGWHGGGWWAARRYAALPEAGGNASLESATASNENASFADLSVLTNETAVGAFSAFLNSSNISGASSDEPVAFWHAGGWHAGRGPAGGWHAGHWHAGGYRRPGWYYHPGGWHAGGWHGGCGPWRGCHAGHWHAGGWHW